MGPDEGRQAVRRLRRRALHLRARGAPAADAAHRFIEFVVSPAANQIIFDTIGWLGFNREVARLLMPGKVDNLQHSSSRRRPSQRVRDESSLPISTAP